jgi:hypothetical protein
MVMNGKKFCIWTIFLALLVTTFYTPVHAQQGSNKENINFLFVTAQKLMKQCIVRFEKNKQLIGGQAQTVYIDRCIAIVVSQMNDPRNANAAVVALPTLYSTLSTLFAGVGTLSAAAVGWIVVAVAAVVVILAAGICSVHDACRTNVHKHIDAIISNVLDELQKNFSWIKNNLINVKQQSFSMFKKLHRDASLTVQDFNRIVQNASVQLNEARENISQNRILMSSELPPDDGLWISLRERIFKETLNDSCKTTTLNAWYRYVQHVIQRRLINKIEAELHAARLAQSFSMDKRHVDHQIMQNFRRLYSLIPEILSAMHVPIRKKNLSYFEQVTNGLKKWRMHFENPEILVYNGSNLVYRSKEFMLTMGSLGVAEKRALRYYLNDPDQRINNKQFISFFSNFYNNLPNDDDPTRNAFASRSSIVQHVPKNKRLLYFMIQDLLSIFLGIEKSPHGLDQILYNMHVIRFASENTMNIFENKKNFLVREEQLQSIVKDILDGIYTKKSCTDEDVKKLQNIYKQIHEHFLKHKNANDQFHRLFNYTIWEINEKEPFSEQWSQMTKSKISFNEALKKMIDGIEYLIKVVYKK